MPNQSARMRTAGIFWLHICERPRQETSWRDAQPLPPRNEAAGDWYFPPPTNWRSFPLTHNPHPATPKEYNEIMSTLAFGKKFWTT